MTREELEQIKAAVEEDLMCLLDDDYDKDFYTGRFVNSLVDLVIATLEYHSKGNI